MTRIAIVGVVRNEEAYLKEWIAFHLLQGVTDFYLTENCSTDSTVKILNECCSTWPMQVTYTQDISNPIQFKAYNFWLKKLQEKQKTPSGIELEWCSFLDSDEYLYSPGGAKLPDILQNYKDASAIAPHWMFFGSNGHKDKTDGLVIERFTKRDKRTDKHSKALVRVRDALNVGRNPHYFDLKPNCKTVDENGNTLKNWYGLKEGGTSDILRVAHFHTKSYGEYMERKKKPDPGTGVIYTRERLEEMFRCHDLSIVEDTSLARWASKVKEMLGTI